MTAEELISAMWERCRKEARHFGSIPAEAVQDLIMDSRAVLDSYGCSKEDADGCLFLVYSDIHWDGNQPTDRVFETMLEFELADYFRERFSA